MSDAIERVKADQARRPTGAYEAMMLEVAETVQRLALWEVKYVAVKDRRHVSVPITVDPKALADEIRRQLATLPQAKVRKLKVRRAKVRTMPDPTRFVRGWGEINLDQAAASMQKLVADIGIVRGQRDTAQAVQADLQRELDAQIAQCRLLIGERDAAEQKVVDEIRTRIALAAEYDRVEKELAKMTEYRDNALWHTDRAREERDAVIAERDQLRRDIAERIGITNTLTLKVQQLTNDLLSSPSHAELGRLRSELEHRYTELERLRVAVRDALKGDQQ